jgi:hypothetical protein
MHVHIHFMSLIFFTSANTTKIVQIFALKNATPTLFPDCGATQGYGNTRCTVCKDKTDRLRPREAVVA